MSASSYDPTLQAPEPTLNGPDVSPAPLRSNLEKETEGGGLGLAEARRIARDAYTASTNWLNAGRRAAWTDALRAFQNKHPTGSKYLSREYAYRSDLFRPKSRAMVRNDEAQTAAAFFSNEDTVSITPGDEDDPIQSASADLIQQLIQYRTTKTIPWFLTVVGARQDCEVQGVCAARWGWKYEEEATGEVSIDPVTGEEIEVMRKVKDEPFCTLLAPENIRIEPGADWRDPVGTSPYIIELIPMYIEDVLDKIEDGEWLDVSEGTLRGATDKDDDVTRRAREQGRVPGKSDDAWKPRAFDIVWVKRNIIRWKGEDWDYYSIGGAGELLSEPKLLKETELHGQRPYVLGYVIVEAHKTYPSSKIELMTDLQRASNDDWNLRFDNLKLSLNPRQFVRAGAQFEQQDLTRFAPGKVIVAAIPAERSIQDSVVWDRPPPPDPAAYAEADRINLDWDQLAGEFNPASVQAAQLREAPATGMHLLSGISSGINEYELRVFAETFVEPSLRLLVKLEQAYETDPVILGLAGRKAQLFQKYGLNHITDELLNQEITTKVNVGIGATNPALKLRNAMGMVGAVGSIFGPIAAQKLDFDEVFKELAGLSGYKDGKRFLRPGPSVQEMQLQQQLQQFQAKAKGGAAPQIPDQSKVQAAQITAQGRVQEQQLQNQRDQRSDAMDMEKIKYQEQQENLRALLKTMHEAEKIQGTWQHELVMAGAGRQHDAMMAGADRQHQAVMGANRPRAPR